MADISEHRQREVAFIESREFFNKPRAQLAPDERAQITIYNEIMFERAKRIPIRLDDRQAGASENRMAARGIETGGAGDAYCI